MMRRMISVCVLAVLMASNHVERLSADGFVAIPENSNTIGVLRDGETYLDFGFLGWGPGWKYLGFRGSVQEDGDRSRLTSSALVSASGANLRFDIAAEQTTAQQLQMNIGLSTDKDTDLTYTIVSLELPGTVFAGGSLVAVEKSGETKSAELPLGRGNLGSSVRQMTLIDREGQQTRITLDPPCDVETDGAVRIVLAGKRLAKKEARQVTLTVDLPDTLTYYTGKADLADDSDMEQWYVWEPGELGELPSELDMSDWLDKPAGKHGRINRENDQLVYDGQPIKLWGLNVCYSSCAPDKELAEKRARFYARYGINSVRLHKYADGSGWAGIQSEGSFVEFDAEALDRMDYFVAQLKQQGIYVLLSSTFGVKLGPQDRQYVPYMDEFGTGGKRVSTGHGSVFLASELQDLQIRQVVRLLEHRNPHTGLTYAQDPAVAVVELFNEDSALFFGTLGRLQKIPTLRRRASEQFCNWLADRYGTKTALLEAWGEAALNSFGNEGLTGESWEDKTIVPAGNPWFFDPDQLADSQASKRQRLLDTMLFLYEIQNDFYSRYVQAIRHAGYEGEILGSNWQAGRAFSHYYNLHSDALVGMIDRHNYFGGGSGAKINNTTMLRVPGSGMLSAGMQQVEDRPFMLSEWIHVFPNEWGVEGPAILGAYGMGLQGWDVSTMFQNRDNGGFLPQLGGSWEVTSPHVLGVFPAVARQVLRGDVRQSEVIASRYVHLPSLHKGQLGFDDRVTQQHDVKTFSSDKVPAEALAVARCVVDFTDTDRPTPAFDLSPYVREGQLVSSTGQLCWRAGTSKLDGSFSIDSPATQAVVGFANGHPCRLGDVTIEAKSHFGAIYVTAKERRGTLADGQQLLVVAVARSRNTGMKIFQGTRLLDRGSTPILMEPVRATITFDRPGDPTVHVLDHNGCRTGRTLPVREGQLEIDGARDRTCYYLVEYR